MFPEASKLVYDRLGRNSHLPREHYKQLRYGGESVTKFCVEGEMTTYNSIGIASTVRRKQMVSPVYSEACAAARAIYYAEESGHLADSVIFYVGADGSKTKLDVTLESFDCDDDFSMPEIATNF